MNKSRTPESIGEFNKKRILNYLRMEGNMSRADLSRNLKMSFPAVSSNVKMLLDAGYIREIGEGNNALGRKSTMLSFEANRGYIIGIDLGRFKPRAMVTDLLGNIKACVQQETIGAGILENISNLVNAAIMKSKIQSTQILCISVGIPGIFHHEEIFIAPFVEKFTNGDLLEYLKNIYPSADVLYENGVNLGVLGVHWKGVGAGYKNIAYISYGVGLGAAFIINNKLYTGSDGAAGEIGFMLNDTSSFRKQFNEIGVLESTLTSSIIHGYIKKESFEKEIAILIQKYDEGDSQSKQILDEIGLNFGMALVNICAVMNPEVLIVSGGVGSHLEKIFGLLWTGMLENHVPFVPKLFFSNLDGQETMMGAIIMGINHVHSEVSIKIES